MYYILFYELVEGYLEKREPLRSIHLNHVQKACDDGLLIMAGAFNEPADGAALIFKTENKSLVEAFAKSDPYVTQGLIRRWYIRPWNVVVQSS